MALVDVVEFTDPACPFAWSAEPSRWWLRWRYGDQIAWTVRMIVLAEGVAELEERGLTPERISAGQTMLAREHGMPIATHQRPLAASLPACRAVVAAREHRGDATARALLRRLRVRNFAGEQLDAPETIAAAADESGIGAATLETWIAEPAVERALRADMDAARDPTPASLAQSDRLASWSGGMRYTCPSYEIAGATTLSVPGFQPLRAYEVAFANAAPDAELRERPESVAEVLAWADEPLATKEVAVVCGIEPEEAREQLARVATEQPVGSDGLWTLA